METIRIFISNNCHYKIDINSKGQLIEKHLIEFFSSTNECTISQAIKKIMEKHSLNKEDLLTKIHRTKKNYGKGHN
jgi:hypothetical protein